MSLLPPDTDQSGGLNRRGVAGPRAGRSPDYRMRGLDVGAPNIAEAPLRPVRRPQRNGQQRRHLVVKWAVTLIVAALVALFLRSSVVQTFSVTSSPMVPTLKVGDRILVAKASFLSGSIKTGEIIVFQHPKHFSCGATGTTAQDLVERVIALPGQTISSNDDTIFVNKKILSEPGWYNPPYGQLGAREIARTKIAPGEYFVMGDNRIDSCDSRAFGPIQRTLILGKAIAITMRNGHPHLHAL
jgi:signal peptidase I